MVADFEIQELTPEHQQPPESSLKSLAAMAICACVGSFGITYLTIEGLDENPGEPNPSPPTTEIPDQPFVSYQDNWILAED